jgi:hypothetical protein
MFINRVPPGLRRSMVVGMGFHTGQSIMIWSSFDGEITPVVVGVWQ